MALNFSRKLDDRLKKSKTFLTVGLDPRPGELPESLSDLEELEALRTFLFGIIDATKAHAAAFKMQLASYLAFGPEGYALLPELRGRIGKDHLTILDLKAADIPSTMELYRTGVFDKLGFDAMTVNPFLGWDSVAAALGNDGHGIFVLLHTSNAGALDLQSIRTGSGTELWESLMPKLKELSSSGNVGAVIGATYPEALSTARRALGGCVPLLVPGVGKQGGDLKEVMSRAMGESSGALLINASRSISAASSGQDWKEAAGKEASRLTAEMRRLAA